MKKQTEEKIQNQIVLWFSKTYPPNKGIIFSVPNEGITKILGAVQYKMKGNPVVATVADLAAITGNTMKSLGMLRGVSDLVVVLPRKILFVEVKMGAGVQTKAQKLFQARCEALGQEYHLIRSLDEFKALM